MLLLDESVPSVFKRIYYARVNDFVIKSFYFTFLGFARYF
ncbi:Two-component system response regulator [Campylobacter concisus]|uniref:Two-component system response regulator n=1 Tax=Campylobacter concisus TaxID=199 RepID=A0A2R4NXG9_9BACT|nr:Two-component system response regulator [Campylobacter concisus]